MKIREIAELLRCQTHRKGAPDGAVREIAAEDFQSVAGLVNFAPKEAKTSVQAELGSRSAKFALKKNDILLRVARTAETAGVACLVEDSPKRPTIPSCNLAILRPNVAAVDPVWLFYRISQHDVRDYLRRNITRTRPCYVKKDFILDLELEEPTEAAVEAAHTIHQRFLEHLRALENFRAEERESWENLGEVFAA